MGTYGVTHVKKDNKITRDSESVLLIDKISYFYYF